MSITRLQSAQFFNSLSKGDEFWAQRCDGFFERCIFETFYPDNVSTPTTGYVFYGIYKFPSSQDYHTTFLNLDSIETFVNPYVDFKKDFLNLEYDPTCDPDFGGDDPQAALSEGSFKTPVNLATTSHLDSIASGSKIGKTLVNGGSNEQLSVDGFLAFNDARILVKNQNNPIHNGIYVVTEQGDSSTPWVLTRDTDSDENDEMPGDVLVFAQDGDVNADTAWLLTNISGLADVDNDDLIFEKFPSVSSSIIGGDGIDISGNIVSVDNTVLRNSDIQDSTVSTNTLYSSNKIESLFSTANGPFFRVEHHLIDSTILNQGYFTLDFEPFSEEDIVMFDCAGSIQINKKGRGDIGTQFEFEMDSVSTKRVYIDNVSSSSTNDEHTGLSGLVEGITVLVLYTYKN